MTRRTLEVELAGCASLVRGYGSREFLETITGRPPLWVRTARAWSCQEKTARDVVSLAERNGYDVVIVGRPVQRVTYEPPAPEVEPEDVGLW